MLSYLLLILLYELRSAHASRAAVAQGGASLVVVAWSYFWNRRWSFKNANKKGREGVRYLVEQAFVFGLSVALLRLMVDVLTPPLTPSWIAMNEVVIV